MQIKWGSSAASGQTAEANAAGGQNSRTRIVRPRHHRRWDRVLVVHSSQQAAKRVVQVDDGAGDVLRVLVVHHLQRSNQPALISLRLFGGKRGHQLAEGRAQFPVRHVLGTDQDKVRERLEQTLMHGAGAGLKRIGGIGESPKGIVGTFVCH